MPRKGNRASAETRAKIAAAIRLAYAEGRHPMGVKGSWHHSEATRQKLRDQQLERSAIVRAAREAQPDATQD
jgi:hypothetical protein